MNYHLIITLHFSVSFIVSIFSKHLIFTFIISKLIWMPLTMTIFSKHLIIIIVIIEFLLIFTSSPLSLMITLLFYCSSCSLFSPTRNAFSANMSIEASNYHSGPSSALLESGPKPWNCLALKTTYPLSGASQMPRRLKGTNSLVSSCHLHLSMLNRWC